MHPKSRKRMIVRLLMILAVVALVGIVDAVVYEPRFPQLTTYHVAVPNLPKSLDGFEIVQLSDIHRRKVVPDSVIVRAVDMANSQNADAVVLTGDFVGRDPADIPACAKMLGKLRSRLGSFAVLGNHDHWTDADGVTSGLEKGGIRVLDNASAKMGKGLYIAGIDDNWAGSPDVSAAMKSVGKGDAWVMLSHSPMAVPLFEGRSGLLITGHTHGGQVRLPFTNRANLAGLLGWKYISGWYKEGDILLYVNRGIGMVNPAVRFFCRPEVTVYVLHPSTDSKARVLDM